MEAVSLNTKENIINAYAMKPSLFYDVEGVLVAKDGKDVKVDKMVGDRKVSYSLKLKEDMESLIGDMVKINKENIVSMQVEEKKEEDPKTKEDIIKRLDLQDDEETKSVIERLLSHEIPVTKENLESFSMSNGYLKDIIHNIDFESCVKLLEMDIDLGEDSLQKIANALAQIKGKGGDLSLKEILHLDRKLSYKEAEGMAKDIYGRSMGRDIYDSIIALHKERLPINKENIEKIMEVMDKLHNLKEYEGEILIKLFKEELPINIETLYKHKHFYNNGKLNTNITSPLYENFTIEKEQSMEELLKLLNEINMAENEENIKLLREFIVNDVEVNEKNFDKILSMKSNIKELVNLLDKETMARLMDEGIDLLKEDVEDLLERIKTQLAHKEVDNSYEAMEELMEVEKLSTITDRELLLLIKDGKDFKIENLKKIQRTSIELKGSMDQQIIEKTITISNIFNTIGELNSDTIAFAVKRNANISLNNLHTSQIELDMVKTHIVEPIDPIEENLIREEYLNAKANIRLSLIEESIKDGIKIESIPLEELNQYINRKTNRYKAVQDLVDRTRQLKGKEEALIPQVMKGHMHMSINQLSNINAILNHGDGIGNLMDSILNGQNMDSYKGVESKVQVLESKVRDLSLSLKEGKDHVKDDYKEMLASLEDLNHSFNSDKGDKGQKTNTIEEYLKLQNQLSKENLVLQIPMAKDKGYANINLIVPDIKKGIDKDNMIFYFNLETDSLGQVRFNLKVKDNKISIDFETDKDELILNNKELLEAGLDRIGYVLDEIDIKI